MSNFLLSPELKVAAVTAVALGITGCTASKYAELDTPTGQPTIAEEEQTVQDMLKDYCDVDMNEAELQEGQREFGRVNNSQNPANPDITAGSEYTLTVAMCPEDNE